MTFRFYVKSLVILGYDAAILVILEEIPQFKVLKTPKCSLCNTQILHGIKFGNFRSSKLAILGILEAMIFEKISHLIAIHSIKDHQNS